MYPVHITQDRDAWESNIRTIEPLYHHTPSKVDGLKGEMVHPCVQNTDLYLEIT